MTQNEIIRMAREAGFEADEANFIFKPKNNRIGIQLELERFAALVAAHEREACAKVCKGKSPYWESCAAAIRARGEK